jgi:restriction endonuclease Mrr
VLEEPPAPTLFSLLVKPIRDVITRLKAHRTARQEIEREKLRRRQEEEECRRKEAQEEEERRRKEAEEEEERRRKEAEESAARAKWAQYYESKTIDDVSMMTGKEFEEFLARLLSRMGYTDISLTPPNDQGGDLLCVSPSGARIVIQAKRWKGSVGNDAVQQLLGALLHYGRIEGMVVTNSRFTGAARQLANCGSNITLHDGHWLDEQIRKYLPREVPEFSWEEFNRLVKHWRPPHPAGSRRRRRRRYWRRY